jgi:hypothetical protein
VNWWKESLPSPSLAKKFLANTDMDRDAELLDRLAARAERTARQERYQAEAMASRQREF